MIIDIRQIKNGTISKLDFDFEESLADFDYLGEKIFENPIKISGSVTNNVGIIKLVYDVDTTLTISCARCLKKINPEMSFSMENALSFTDSEDDDVFVVKSDKLDLSEIILPAVMLDVEMSYLCSEDCKGLCSKCGTDFNETTCNCDTRTIDPRLEVLKKLLD